MNAQTMDAATIDAIKSSPEFEEGMHRVRMACGGIWARTAAFKWPSSDHRGEAIEAFAGDREGLHRLDDGGFIDALDRDHLHAVDQLARLVHDFIALRMAPKQADEQGLNGVNAALKLNGVVVECRVTGPGGIDGHDDGSSLKVAIEYDAAGAPCLSVNGRVAISKSMLPWPLGGAA